MKIHQIIPESSTNINAENRFSHLLKSSENYDDRIQRLARIKDKEIDTTLELEPNNFDSNNLDLDLDLDVMQNQPKTTSGRETTLDKFKRWNKMLRGKEPVYTTPDGTDISVDAFGDEKSIKFNKKF